MGMKYIPFGVLTQAYRRYAKTVYNDESHPLTTTDKATVEDIMKIALKEVQR